MLITMYSNYLTHHQVPFCEAMCQQKDIDFYFVSTEKMEEERISGGWQLKKQYPYEIKAYENAISQEKAYQLAEKSDVIIVGSAPEIYVQKRMKSIESRNKLTFRYSERFYKNGRWRVISPRGLILRYQTYFRYIGKPLYMLCASSYTCGDLAMLGSYIGRCYKWGYFPKTIRYKDINDILSNKKSRTIIWVARMIKYKHPEKAIYIAQKLKNENIDFHLTMVGNGPLFNHIYMMIQKNNLQKYITLIGSIPEEEVRTLMEQHDILLATSDYHEGWGAVVNEGMNSGCVPVISSSMGSAGFLIKNGINGYACSLSDNVDDEMYLYIKTLLFDKEKKRNMSINAYHTIVDEWNAENAAFKFVNICRELMNGKKKYYGNGVCSKASIFTKRNDK